jgi:hypothetical protein
MAANATYAYDLAISAVSYDTLLVNDVVSRLAPRLGDLPAWSGSASIEGLVAPLVHEDVSRLVLVLVQRLWGHDDATAAESAVLRDRACRAPRSVIVVSLDDDPLPRWMAPLRHCELASSGVDGIVRFALDAIADAGGTVRAGWTARSAEAPTSAARWSDPPTPFLDQPRAYGALRRELDELYIELQPRLDQVGGRGGEHTLELHQTPNRVIARLDDVSVSFSWVPGRAGTVADGRLMVIEWSGIGGDRGFGALRAARPVRECVYSAEANSTDDWRWRADVPNGRASSTANLVGEWMAGATMTARTLVPDDAQ